MTIPFSQVYDSAVARVGWRGLTAYLPVAAVTLGLVASVFSITLVQLATALGWVGLCVVVAGASRTAAPRLPLGLWAPALLFFGASAISASLSEAPLVGWAIVGKEMLAFGLAVAASQLSRARDVRLALGAFLVVAGLAAAWSIPQIVIQFGGVVDVDHRTYGFRGPWDFVWHGHVSAVAFSVALGVGLWQVPGLAPTAVASGVAAVIGMLSSFTRAAWLVSTAFAGVVLLWRRSVAGLLVLGAVLGLIATLPWTRHFVARATSSFDVAVDGENVYRVVRYQMGAEIARDYPVLGVGPGGLKPVFPRYARPGAGENTHLHNTALQLLAERGPLALAAWLALGTGAAVRALWRVRRRGREQRGLAVAVALGLAMALALGNFDYDWSNWQMRALTLVFIGLAWSPALAARGFETRVAGRTS